MSRMESSKLWGKITILVALCGWALSAQAKYDGGSGEPNNPYQISSVADWQELMTTPADWASHFVLTGDLDLDGVLLSPIGNDANNFTGVFEGSDYIIRNAVINQPADYFVGLFGYLGYGGQIRNLGVEDANISGFRFVGGLVGRDYSGTISSCYATGAVTGQGEIGGLAGTNEHGTISHCYATAVVTSTSLPDHYYFSFVGGLCGGNWGIISGCYATGTVAGTGWVVGGLVGINYAPVSYCYATGAVTGIIGAGGLAGYNYPDSYATITACFWDMWTSGQAGSSGGTRKTTVEMQTLSTFTAAGWDFVGETTNGPNDVWRMCVDGVDYPQLTWEYVQVGDFACPDGVNAGDLMVLCEDWLSPYSQALYGADANGDKQVTFADFAILAQRWLSAL